MEWMNVDVYCLLNTCDLVLCVTTKIYYHVITWYHEFKWVDCHFEMLIFKGNKPTCSLSRSPHQYSHWSFNNEDIQLTTTVPAQQCSEQSITSLYRDIKWIVMVFQLFRRYTRNATDSIFSLYRHSESTVCMYVCIYVLCRGSGFIYCVWVI